MSVVLTVRRGEGEDHIQGTAYFDDLCVSFTQGGFSSSPGVRHLTTTEAWEQCICLVSTIVKG